MLSCGGNLVGDFALGKPPYRHFPDHQLFIHLDSSRLVNNRMIAASLPGEDPRIGCRVFAKEQNVKQR